MRYLSCGNDFSRDTTELSQPDYLVPTTDVVAQYLIGGGWGVLRVGEEGVGRVRRAEWLMGWRWGDVRRMEEDGGLNRRERRRFNACEGARRGK